METLVAVLAFIVASEYIVIAFAIVPRLSRIARVDQRTTGFARWGATAFFVGCAATHTLIALQTLYPSLRGAMDMTADSGTTKALLLQMVIPHVAQIVGGAIFIWIAGSRLEVSITSKEDAEQARQLDRQFRAAFDRAPLGIALLAPAGQITDSAYVNPAYLDIFGYEPDGPVPTGDPSLAMVHPDDRAACTAVAQRVQSGEPAELEFRVVRSDGVIRRVHSRQNAVTDDGGAAGRVTTILEDITDRVNAQAALQDSEHRFRQLAASVTVGIVLRQLSPPRVLFANAAYIDIIGADPTREADTGSDTTESSTGSATSGSDTGSDPTLAFLHPDDHVRVMRDYWWPAQAGETVESEHRVLRADGQIRWVHATSNPVLDGDGSVSRVAGTVEDITARKRGEAAQAAQLLAEQANAAKNEFLSRMSHELRTPLNAVLGFGQLMELEPMTKPQEDSVGHILHAGRHLLTLIDEVLDISRIESEELEISLAPVDIATLVKEVVGLMSPAAAAAAVTLTLEPGPAGPGPFVSADRRRMQQVMLNLISNAIKYNSRNGSVLVGLRTADEDRLEITVSDTGIGISAEDLPRLFTPFDRLGYEDTDIEGTGLGLALTRRLVTAMLGSLEVTSTPGVGSTFTVALTLVAPPTNPVPAALTRQKVPVPTPGRPASTLLYIEDNPANAHLMAKIVGRRPSWSLVHAADGRRGLALAGTLNPTLILLDLHLPDIHGAQVLRKLRADPTTASIPVIVLSADANPSEIALLQAAGALRYRTKPLNVGDILADLDEHASV